ncbi:peptide chain release factor 1 [Candidatus Phytoplasma bonamiae]|uniref:Peptide chain release factor 1 n=1 Tax=Candidatus Phytoplasma bonamiae TaxID=2982626 RepID=A0ABT9D3H4_9MOLU|nr:peptide chain release factor 1 ['Bonamia sp.' little leaf phytoplasma]MDO8063964.1 peptide chain release factor 1 ['Bonamia sp.' little leaf phytoplasma]MDV3174677.1 peptide chain release factor 1 ['Bonamia sp.' little leaf phytoplasma]
MFNKLELIKKKYLKNQKKILENPKNLQNIDLLKEINKLQKIVLIYEEYIQLEKEYKKIKQILSKQNYQIWDKEIIKLLETEKNNLNKKIQNKTHQLEKLLSPEQYNKEDKQNVIIEIKKGIGGQESNLFVADLFRAYKKYIEDKKWKLEIINLSSTTKEGISSVEFLINGKNVFYYLKYESGIHRVQRIPKTENKGRIHTSTAKILVIPNDDNHPKIDINWNDIRVDTFNASGPGGQSVNTTKSAVRLTHLPTGISTACQTAKSQHENKEKAFKLLINKIYYQKQSEQKQKKNQIKKDLIGKSDRSEKIRTYDYPNNKITDHRINLSIYKLNDFMEGNMDLIIKPLIDEFQQQKWKDNF